MTDTNTASFSELIILLLPTKVTHVGLLFRVQKFQFNYHLITKVLMGNSPLCTNHKNEQEFEKLFDAMSCEKKITVKVILRQSSCLVH